MSWSREIRIRCDRCGCSIHSGGSLDWSNLRPTVRQMREAGRKYGWRLREGEDVCPSCVREEDGVELPKTDLSVLYDNARHGRK